MAEFHDPEDLIAAADRARLEGYRRMDAYTPFPVEGLVEALGTPRTKLPLLVLIGGLVGCLGGLYLQYWVAAVAYPLNVGGRPYFSIPAFIPITFECTVLAASLTAVFGMLALNKLPLPYHPVFNVERFQLASRNRFFLCIEARDPKFDRDRTEQFLQSLQPDDIEVVEH
jgi:hypothetical protein